MSDDENLFGDYDIEGAPDDPFNLDDGTYTAVIEGFEKVEGNRKKDQKPYRGITVSFADVTDSSGEEQVAYDHYLSLPVEGDAKKTRDAKLSSVKTFLSGLEVPPSRMNSVTADDLVGLKVIFQLKTSKNDFRNMEIRLYNGAKPGTTVSADEAEKLGPTLGKDSISDFDF